YLSAHAIYVREGPGLNRSASSTVFCFFWSGSAEWSSEDSSKDRFGSVLFLNFTKTQVILSHPEPSPSVLGARQALKSYNKNSKLIFVYTCICNTRPDCFQTQFLTSSHMILKSTFFCILSLMKSTTSWLDIEFLK